jgi:formyltetrahydrofolate deformylase
MKSIQPLREKKDTAILLIHCPDKQGILATVTEFLNRNNGNIIYLDQHVDRQEMIFYMRVEWELTGFSIPRDKIGEYFETLIANTLQMTWRLYFSTSIPRMALFVSLMPHCLFDILARYTAGEWDVNIPLIISNHDKLEPVAKRFGIDFYHFPVSRDNKDELEKQELELLKENKIDFIVLARYMQILSKDFVAHYPNKIINIHHSFLPAFAGAKPYHAAHERGVKIIGATSHYVTSDLDAGPIIEQDVTRCSHADTVENLIRKGRDLEKIVLSQAVFKHLERKILVFKNRTVVFN